MKELTIEEKAKAYDEALEHAKTLYENANGMILKKWVEQVFPELKKSEDESIIRDIRVVLESSATRIFKENGQMPVWYDRAVAWLEKQGEQKPTNNHFTTEQAGILDKHIDKFIEQKPAWSEDDKRIKDNCISFLKFNINKEYSPQAKCIDECINWLNSLRPQKQWKPSNEQMNALEHFVRSICESGYASPYDNNTKVLYSLLSDLKKLKG